MSYLLDALKKAEAERASLESGESGQTSVEQSKASVLPGWVVLVVVSLLSLTTYKLFFDGQKEGVDELHELVVEDVSKSPMVATDTRPILGETMAIHKTKEADVDSVEEVYQLKQGEVLIEPTTASPSPVVVESKETRTKKEERSFQAPPLKAKNPNQPKQLAELTKSQLSRIPSLSLESHLYSSVAEYSSVVINGKTYSEGDYLSSQVIIKKIDANGIVISLGDLLVELPKGISWVSTNHVK